MDDLTTEQMPNPVEQSAAVVQNKYVDTPTLRYVGFTRRFIAALIDVAILLVIEFAVAMMLGLLFQEDSVKTMVNIVSNIINVAVGYTYAIVFLSKKGATPGKMAMGIKVVTEDGKLLTPGRAALREIIGKWVSTLPLLLGYLWVIWDKKKQGFHDKIANTVVIYSK